MLRITKCGGGKPTGSLWSRTNISDSIEMCCVGKCKDCWCFSMRRTRDVVQERANELKEYWNIPRRCGPALRGNSVATLKNDAMKPTKTAVPFWISNNSAFSRIYRGVSCALSRLQRRRRSFRVRQLEQVREPLLEYSLNGRHFTEKPRDPGGKSRNWKREW